MFPSGPHALAAQTKPIAGHLLLHPGAAISFNNPQSPPTGHSSPASPLAVCWTLPHRLSGFRFLVSYSLNNLAFCFFFLPTFFGFVNIEGSLLLLLFRSVSIESHLSLLGIAWCLCKALAIIFSVRLFPPPHQPRFPNAGLLCKFHDRAADKRRQFRVGIPPCPSLQAL